MAFSVLDSIDPELDRLVTVAAVANWFDAVILAAIEPALADRAAAAYETLQGLAIVEPWGELGHRVQPEIREACLARLWADRPETFRAFSARAAVAFEARFLAEAQAIDRVEAWVHWAIAEPERAEYEVGQQAQAWHNDFQLTALAALLNRIGAQGQRLRPETAALVLYWEGRLNHRTYRTDEAIDRYQAALDLYEALGDRLGQAHTRRVWGDLCQFLKQSPEALAHYTTALDLYRAVGDRLDEANTLKALGDLFQFTDQTEAAIDHYGRALTLYRDLGDRLGQANTLKAQGDLYQFLTQPHAAVDHYDHALVYYQAVGDRLGEANTLQALGDSLQMLDRRNDAIDHYDRALALHRDLGDRLGEANTLKVQGDLFQVLGQTDQALDRYTTALDLYQQVNSRLGEANVRQVLGDFWLAQGQPDQAIDHYNAALPIYQAIGDRLGEANTLQELAKLDLETDPAAALAKLQQSQATYEAIGDRYSYGRNLWFLAVAHLNLDDPDPAIAALAERIAIGEAIGYEPFIVHSRDRITEIRDYFDLDD